VGKTVNIFTRHRLNCQHKAKESFNRCYCPKFAQWSDNGRVNRQTLKTDSFDVATRKAYELQALVDAGKNPSAQGVTVKQAVESYIADKEAQRLSPETISKLELIFEKSLLPFCEKESVATLDQITLPLLQQWRSTWTDKSLAASKKQERVRGFFKWTVGLGWLKQNPAVGLSRIKVTQTPTSWFTPEQFEKIEKTAQQERFGEKLHALILLMRWSGLAIRDAVTLERSRLHQDDDSLFLYRAKTGTPVSVTLPPEVAAKLRAVVNENNQYFFWSGRGTPKSAVADYQRALRRVFERAEVKGKSHMFRNTFSVSLLMAGVSIHDVALLLGHSSVKTTEKHYAPFVMERRDNLLDAVKAAWVGRVEEV
jgi:integrase/recombinase XerD